MTILNICMLSRQVENTMKICKNNNKSAYNLIKLKARFLSYEMKCWL